MGIEEYPRNLEILAQQRYLGRYLDAASKGILFERAKSLRGFLQKRRRRPVEWKFSIPIEHPLTFIKNDVDNCRLQIDISCEIEGIGDDIKKYNILLRVWCWDENISYREGIDAVELKSKFESLGWKRVILRFHFDLKDTKTKKPEPFYHLHVGGIPEDDENCWFPKQIKVPRFPYPPMDIILLCEFVLVNFFQKESEELRKKPEWKSLVRKSQEVFQKNYFAICKSNLDNKTGTLLENLCTLSEGCSI